ncbi:hypothetical protein PUNSTDRAFT_133099 [Punctularia strigosozonata HHB-11173 SS5]|uniref:uncharacterized protein n=1 Tax=Punctularia strigosozonata (strain HHB-11173) TaxID=741275 RepID=UPI000441767E|nr:uncharacterized protein PUNSTDRAFT_133099 [Punctularia strigosozonata HHB-11173 SS5]EIN11045.1 hypothetical protein PUNSTDRAFT_133099 [Punctularia strigosozonata HHB-11173 SS5]
MADGEALPAYTEPIAGVPREPVVHCIQLETSKQKAWVTLTIQSRARNAQQLPEFLEGDKITGSLDLDLDKGDSIIAISVSVVGILTFPDSASGGVHESKQDVFLNVSRTLWNLGMGDPCSVNSTSTSTSRQKFTAKLLGKYSFAFTLELGREVSYKLPKQIATKVGDDGLPKPYRLPPTCEEGVGEFSIHYELVAHLQRGTFKADTRLGRKLVYSPHLQPDPPSALRQLVYQENADFLLGPHGDPLGWHTVQTAIIEGTIFKMRHVELRCTLSLARPLCYTRGSIIPLSLLIESQDQQALDLFATPYAIRVCLVRRQTCHPGIKSKVKDTMKLIDGHYLVSSKEIEFAAWWPDRTPQEVPGSAERRVLQGEIRIPSMAIPSASFAILNISYFVATLPFSVAAFEAGGDSPRSGNIITVPVTVGTVYANGPQPKAFTPPGYKNHLTTTRATYSRHESFA